MGWAQTKVMTPLVNSDGYYFMIIRAKVKIMGEAEIERLSA